MKNKDWAAVIGVVLLAAIVSFALSNLLFGGKKAVVQNVETVNPISNEFPLPNSKYFNKQSLNPTQQIEIGENNNQTPFNGR